MNLYYHYADVMSIFTSIFYDILGNCKEMKSNYKNNEITKEVLQDWKANYPDSLKKDYVPFEESNLKRFNNGMSVKVPPEIK